jgi:DAK2 domain fusion protein YloV
MTAGSTLEAADVRRSMVAYRDVLRAHQEAINRLNVFPVPDGDTGTNMALTLDAVVAELDQLDESADMAAICKAVAHGSLMGARGNSGVILSQLLRGLAEHLGERQQATPPEVASALVTAGEMAYQAVVRPVEGTILTVARAAGEGAAAAAEKGGELVGVLESARRSAADALEHTPELLEALARAGVVDAGGAGYVLFFDALLSAVEGRPLPAPPPATNGAIRRQPPAHAGPSGAAGMAIPDGAGTGPHLGAGDLRYEVMYLLQAPDDTIADFKEVWAGIGDSIVVVGGDGLWNCHIHTNDIGAAIEAGLDAGRPRDIRVTDLAEEVDEERWVREGAGAPLEEPPPGPVPTTAVVAVVTGDGVGRIFRSLGVHHQVRGGQSMNPSTAQLLEAVEDVPSSQVVILPNNPNIRPVAEQVQALTTKVVRVVPTDSVVEGFAALLDYDPAADVEANERSMTASARRVVPGEVTRAVRDAATGIGPVREGDWIGLSKDGVVSVAGSLAEATCRLLEHLLAGGHELVTLIEGEGATAADTRRVTEWLHDEHPGMAVEVHHGGQPLYPYLLGIE